MTSQNDKIISPQLLLEAYSEGFFPMANSETGEIEWYSPNPRAIFPLHHIKPSHSTKQILKKKLFEVKFDTCFERVILGCANRPDSWINDVIINSYINLHHLGYAHSVETFKDGELVGGLYGVAIGAAFFGESMFSKVSNASKVAFYYLVERLKEKGFVLLDSQFINPHTKMLGAIEISRNQYLKILKFAIYKTDVKF
ncbi:MAG: leucyl/phenylalanyl-tRNA--protein transferase [Ignavibacteria bacterium]|nr:leucyl/phenylalanyl-tRNA--protein transferase [Ignavibacteria bacterium]